MLDRRRFLRNLALGAAGAATFSPSSLIAAAPVETGARELALKNIHTGESITAAYWENGSYQLDAIAEFNKVLRDWRTGEATDIDPSLLDYVHDVRRLLETTDPIEVISGYRSPKTNQMLIEQGRGAAKKSFHMQGRAIDISFEKHSPDQVHKAAVALERGGVGYYGRSGFIHLDTGSVRRWGGGPVPSPSARNAAQRVKVRLPAARPASS